MDLFEKAREDDPNGVPLAERMRPKKLDEVVGQPHLVGEGAFLARVVKQGHIPSIIFWGPPGTGKTTLAEALSNEVDARFVKISAVLAGVKDLREAVEEARRARAERGRGTILFVDEIHRFNKGQQDALLPHVEKGVITLVGATTENPSFEVNAALLSRCRVLVTKPIDDDALASLVGRALSAERGLAPRGLSIDDDAQRALVTAASGDARRVLTSLEVAADMAESDAVKRIALAHVEQAVARRVLLYDKAGEEHYNVVSAFIKSMRGSDPDAAIHYMVRMLEAGEDPLFILRRMVIFASEDVGNADPVALQTAVAALQAFELVGLPEGAIPMAQACTYLASTVKSNASYLALGEAKADLHAHGPLPVPMHLRNAPTSLMKGLGYGKGYEYPHDHAGGFVAAQYLPDAIAAKRYYRPTEHGVEKRIKERLAGLKGSKG
jgi:putative ATPase